MKKIALFSIIALFCGMVMMSCGGNKAAATAEEAPATMSVDELMAQAENLVGDTVVVEGVCSHLCRHGGRKAFVVGSADSVVIRCEAYPLMGEPFPTTTIHKPIEVKGLLCEDRIDEEAIQKMVQQYQDMSKNVSDSEGLTGEEAASAPKAESGCDAERAAAGQQNLTTFEERIADYRARIAERQAKEGKSYLSFYYLQAVSYETLPE